MTAALIALALSAILNVALAWALCRAFHLLGVETLARIEAEFRADTLDASETESQTSDLSPEYVEDLLQRVRRDREAFREATKNVETLTPERLRRRCR